jgi:hypothetical protein
LGIIGFTDCHLHGVEGIIAFSPIKPLKGSDKPDFYGRRYIAWQSATCPEQ